MANGEVLVNDQPLRNKLARFIDKKIHQWVERVEHREGAAPGESAEPDALDYKVAFTQDSDVKQVSCVTEIRLGGNLWRGCELASDTQSAFIHSLKRLQPH